MNYRVKQVERLIFVLLFIFFGAAYSTVEVFAQDGGETKIYKGMCDASAAVALDEKTFIVASDENNDLRIYGKNNSEELQRIKLSEVFKGKISDGNNLEIDIEGATRLGDKIFWTGSHGASKTGKPRPSRQRLFAVKISRDGGTGKFIAVPAGKIYTDLISDLENDLRFNEFKLKEAEIIRPKDIGGLSIEALAATPEGHLLIGFRNPLIGGQTSADKILKNGKSLIVELLNPLEVIGGKTAKFAAPIILNLNGLGVRGLEYDNARKIYLVVAGPYFDAQEILPQNSEVSESRFYVWTGKRSDEPQLRKKIKLSGFNAETAFVYPQTANVQLLSDDGKADCSESFRGRLLKF